MGESLSKTEEYSVTKTCLKYIEEQARLFYQQQDAFHNESHGERVVAFALRINQIEKADAFLVEAGAWLHQFHDHLSELQKVLKHSGLPETTQNQLYEIVRLCRPALISSSSPLEARIVFDADAMDLMGAQGVMRELSCNLIVRGLSYNKAVQETQKTQALFEQKLKTEAGRSIAQEAIKTSKAFWDNYERW